MNTEITTFGRGGRSETARFSTGKRVNVGEVGGHLQPISREMERRESASGVARFSSTRDSYRGSATFAAAADPALAALDFVPVIAVTAGDYTGVFDVTNVDSVGNLIRTVVSSAVGVPISDATTYKNGVLIGTIHSAWTPVTGGYVLANQRQVNYTDGNVITNVYSTVSAGHPTTTKALGGSVRLALNSLGHKVVCALSPEVAYAEAPKCLSQGLEFAGVTAALGITLYVAWRNPLVFVWGAVERQALYTEIAGWTYTLHNFLKCMGGPPSVAKKLQ